MRLGLGHAGRACSFGKLATLAGAGSSQDRRCPVACGFSDQRGLITGTPLIPPLGILELIVVPSSSSPPHHAARRARALTAGSVPPVLGLALNHGRLSLFLPPTTLLSHAGLSSPALALEPPAALGDTVKHAGTCARTCPRSAADAGARAGVREPPRMGPLSTISLGARVFIL